MSVVSLPWDVSLGEHCVDMLDRYLAQGAAQATEDAAALATALRTFSSIPEALQAYERARKARSTYVARNTRVLQEWLHLYDGPARNERDRLMESDAESNPIYWGWTQRKDWLLNYDASKLEEAEIDIPSLPHMPPDEARVYLGKKSNGVLQH